MAPSSHPQAQFVPISPDLDLGALVENTDNFDYVTRLSTEKLQEHSIQSFEALVLAVVIQSGKPLVIEDWPEKSLPPWLFSRHWLEENMGTKAEKVRDLTNGVDIPMTMGHYLRSMGQLTKQFSSATYRDPKRQRLYLKDIDCPEMWGQKLQEELPDSIYYLNECIEARTGGDGAIREPNEYGQMRYGKGVAPAGDLMSSLPPEMRALNMMCYIGHEGTYTPAHREMCASLGHNIMVEASEDRNGEKAGSSIWFMTETKERELVSEHFLSMLGHDIEVEKHFAQINAWKKAPFNVWVVEQKPGDLILIPPLAPHQVWNRGTRTMKAAWNRTTVDTLELAIHEALPRGRMVCRDEQYKNKAIIYYTLVKYYDLLQRDTIEPKMWKYGRIKQLLDDFRRLFSLYTEILVSEMFSPKLPEETDVEFLEFDSNVTCSYCRCNIFNRFLTCKSCIEHGPNGEEDTYDICMDCYAMGRSCACISGLNWVEQWKWPVLLENYEKWRDIVVHSDGHFDVQRSPQPIEVARKRYGKKAIAEVCQEQLKIRPWTDITKPVVRDPSPGMSDVEPEVDDNGRPKNRKKAKFTRRKLQPIKNKTHTCHVCCHHEWNWKLAFCTTCNLAYCYGVLWRAFDLMPQTVMEDKDWQCPKCMKMCSCGKCRKGGTQKTYEPKGTLLGHDTRKVADFRSVESLVDFSKTNLIWLRGDEDESPQKTSRMKKLKEKAEADKSRVDTVNKSYLEEVPQDPFLAAPAEANGNMTPEILDDIDPALRDTGGFTSASNGHANGHYDSFFEQDPAMAENGGLSHTNGDDPDASHSWMDGHYDLDDNDAFNNQNQNTGYPSRLLAPVAPMFADNGEYPELGHNGQSRMMGMGYYQQRQGNDIDQILYDPPNSNGSVEDSQSVPVQNPNLALSDLIPTQYEPVENTRKRKRFGEGTGNGDDAEDMEFFTSKKQRKIAKTKKAALVKSDVVNAVLLRDGPQRKPRRSAVKSKVYIDLGEEAVPIEDDEGPSTVSQHKPRPRANHLDDDLQLAAQAMNRLANPEAKAPKQAVPRKRKSTGSPVISVPKPQPRPRKSAWLARKEAEESGVALPEESRTRRSLASKDNTTKIIDITSDSEGNSDADSETDSLFGEPVEGEKSLLDDEDGDFYPKKNAKPTETETNGDEGIKWRVSKDHPGVQLAEAGSTEKHTPKRRGRPPKQAKARSPSPDMANSTAKPKMLSLREKLAAKGKGLKIVAAKARKSIKVTPGPSSARNTPSARNTLSVAIPVPSTGRSTPSVAIPAFRSPSPISSEDDQVYDISRLMRSNSVSSIAPTAASGAAKLSNSAAGSPDPRVPQHTVRLSAGLSDELANELASTLAAPKSKQLAGISNGTPNLSTVRASSRPVTLSDGITSTPALQEPAQPVKKGPTVVRLSSPDSESEGESEGYTSDEPEINRPEPKSQGPILNDDSSSDSDASIPAVRPGYKAIRGGGSFARRGAPNRAVRGRGRPRGRPSTNAAH
ncbi:hypothetical protein LHYA1_G007294 [Lachnellula hyalina]|uniref:JmjC domain-containing protein n=1 Tax=Lachnellula hyalina TaxID=1316788 RepID=A0A8H8QWY7_9HELO|nr:uncharacterized protein LHYA1_G007294 [Lachnellula hyalina]TVY23250.1 hypothetical protein LHYA1_G007294 [Lachnellula hyalina]